MKKLPIFFLVLTLSLSGWALPAGGASSGPPKSLCVNWVDPHLTPPNNIIAVMSLAIKMSGTINMQPGPVKFYAIQGQLASDGLEYMRVSGSGHMKGSNFYFSLSGSNWFDGDSRFQTVHMEGLWNITNQSGTIRYEARSGSAAPLTGSYNLTPKSCSEVPLYGDH